MKVDTTTAWNSYVNTEGISRREADKTTTWARHLTFGIPRAYRHCLAGEKFKFKDPANTFLRKNTIQSLINKNLFFDAFLYNDDIKYVVRHPEFTFEDFDMTVKIKPDYILQEFDGTEHVLFVENFQDSAFSFREDEGFNEHDIQTAQLWAALLGIPNYQVVYFNRDKNGFLNKKEKLDPDVDFEDLKKELDDLVTTLHNCITETDNIDNYELKESWMRRYSPFKGV